MILRRTKIGQILKHGGMRVKCIEDTNEGHGCQVCIFDGTGLCSIECAYKHYIAAPPKPRKPLDRNSQAGRLYANMIMFGDWLPTVGVSVACGGFDESDKHHGPSYAPSTRISELRKRLRDLDSKYEIETDLRDGVYYYRLSKATT